MELGKELAALVKSLLKLQKERQRKLEEENAIKEVISPETEKNNSPRGKISGFFKKLGEIGRVSSNRSLVSSNKETKSSTKKKSRFSFALYESVADKLTNDKPTFSLGVKMDLQTEADIQIDSLEVSKEDIPSLLSGPPSEIKQKNSLTDRNAFLGELFRREKKSSVRHVAVEIKIRKKTNKPGFLGKTQSNSQVSNLERTIFGKDFSKFKENLNSSLIQQRKNNENLKNLSFSIPSNIFDFSAFEPNRLDEVIETGVIGRSGSQENARAIMIEEEWDPSQKEDELNSSIDILPEVNLLEIGLSSQKEDFLSVCKLIGTYLPLLENKFNHMKVSVIESIFSALVTVSKYATKVRPETLRKYFVQLNKLKKDHMI